MNTQTVINDVQIKSLETFLIGYLVFAIIILTLSIVAFWKLFQKAGVAGWKSLVPFYSAYLQYQIACGNGWMFLTQLIPVIGFVFPIIMTFKTAKAFGHGVAMGFGLMFLPFIFYPVLAFGKSQYIGPQ